MDEQLGFATLPAATTRPIAAKFFRDCSSVHVVAPAASGSSRNGVPDVWHDTQRAWPWRLARKIGWTRVLKKSKSREAGRGRQRSRIAAEAPAGDIASSTDHGEERTFCIATSRRAEALRYVPSSVSC